MVNKRFLKSFMRRKAQRKSAFHRRRISIMRKFAEMTHLFNNEASICFLTEENQIYSYSSIDLNDALMNFLTSDGKFFQYKLQDYNEEDNSITPRLFQKETVVDSEDPLHFRELKIPSRNIAELRINFISDLLRKKRASPSTSNWGARNYYELSKNEIQTYNAPSNLSKRPETPGHQESPWKPFSKESLNKLNDYADFNQTYKSYDENKGNEDAFFKTLSDMSPPQNTPPFHEKEVEEKCNLVFQRRKSVDAFRREVFFSPSSTDYSRTEVLKGPDNGVFFGDRKEQLYQNNGCSTNNLLEYLKTPCAPSNIKEPSGHGFQRAFRAEENAVERRQDNLLLQIFNMGHVVKNSSMPISFTEFQNLKPSYSLDGPEEPSSVETKYKQAEKKHSGFRPLKSPQEDPSNKTSKDVDKV